MIAVVPELIWAYGWLPSAGNDKPTSAILPIVTLGIAGAAILARFTRSAMLEVLGQPYIRAASAKGLAWRRVVVEHALPNAAIPTTTIVGFMVGTLAEGHELMALARAGKIKPTPMQEEPMGDVQKWIDELRAGKVVGRIVLKN